MENYINYFINFTYFDTLEFFATLMGIISVYYSTQRNQKVFVFGLISTSIYLFIFFSVDMWYNSLVNLIYTILNIYGWIQWHLHPDSDSELVAVRRLELIQLIQMTLVILAVMMIAASYFVFFQNSITSPIDFFIDVFTAIVFAVAMWLMAMRYIEHWYLWIIGNLLILPALFSTKLYFSIFQYFIFTLMAIYGLVQWRRDIDK